MANESSVLTRITVGDAAEASSAGVTSCRERSR